MTEQRMPIEPIFCPGCYAEAKPEANYWVTEHEPDCPWFPSSLAVEHE